MSQVKKSKRSSTTYIKPISPDLKCGWLKKLSRSGLIKNKTTRYFVLLDGTLSYYLESSPQEPYGDMLKGSIHLSDCKIIDTNEKSNELLIETSETSKENNLLIEFNNLNEKNEWKILLEDNILYLKNLKEYNEKKLEREKKLDKKLDKNNFNISSSISITTSSTTNNNNELPKYIALVVLPSFGMKTKNSSGEKVLIHVYTNELLPNIPPPIGFNKWPPMVVSKSRSFPDNAALSTVYTVYSIAVHPKVIELFSTNSEASSATCSRIMRQLRKKYGEALVLEYEKVPVEYKKKDQKLYQILVPYDYLNLMKSEGILLNGIPCLEDEKDMYDLKTGEIVQYYVSSSTTSLSRENSTTQSTTSDTTNATTSTSSNSSPSLSRANSTFVRTNSTFSRTNSLIDNSSGTTGTSQDQIKETTRQPLSALQSLIASKNVINLQNNSARLKKNALSSSGTTPTTSNISTASAISTLSSEELLEERLNSLLPKRQKLQIPFIITRSHGIIIRNKPDRFSTGVVYPSSHILYVIGRYEFNNEIWFESTKGWILDSNPASSNLENSISISSSSSSPRSSSISPTSSPSTSFSASSSSSTDRTSRISVSGCGAINPQMNEIQTSSIIKPHTMGKINSIEIMNTRFEEFSTHILLQKYFYKSFHPLILSSSNNTSNSTSNTSFFSYFFNVNPIPTSDRFYSSFNFFTRFNLKINYQNLININKIIKENQDPNSNGFNEDGTILLSRSLLDIFYLRYFLLTNKNFIPVITSSSSNISNSGSGSTESYQTNLSELFNYNLSSSKFLSNNKKLLAYATSSSEKKALSSKEIDLILTNNCYNNWLTDIDYLDGDLILINDVHYLLKIINNVQYWLNQFLVNSYSIYSIYSSKNKKCKAIIDFLTPSNEIDVPLMYSELEFQSVKK